MRRKAYPGSLALAEESRHALQALTLSPSAFSGPPLSQIGAVFLPLSSNDRQGQMTAMSVPTLKESLVAEHQKNMLKSVLLRYISITSCSSGMHRPHQLPNARAITQPATKSAPRSAAPHLSSPMAISAAAAATQKWGR